MAPALTLDHANGRAYAVVSGAGTAETWVDVAASLGANPSAGAGVVAASIIDVEGCPRRDWYVPLPIVRLK